MAIEQPTDGVEAGSTPRRERLGRYVLHHVLGRGGMATVYLGRMMGDGGFERWVAVKRVHEHLVEDEEARRMFLDEARTAAMLQHQNLVQVTDFGEANGRPYLVMEYINGETLSALMRRASKAHRPLDIPIVVRIMAWACDGLHHAHELRSRDGQPLGLIHRDVSPQNIIVSYDGGTKVTDFGIAKAAGRLQHTRTGQAKGKLTYMSPEQAVAQPLDRRSDIFSLGIVLWEATLGRRLFKFDSDLETLQRIVSAEVPGPCQVDPHYPEALEQVVLKALAKRPDDRYATAREMQRDLEQFLLTVGYPLGTAEVAELMGALFADKRESRERMMSAVEVVGIDEAPTVTSVELSPSTLSLPVGVAVEARPARSSWRGLLFGAATLVVLALALGLWLLVDWGAPTTTVADRGSPPSAAPAKLPATAPLAEPTPITPVTPTPIPIDAGPGGEPAPAADSGTASAQPVEENDGGAPAVERRPRAPARSPERDRPRRPQEEGEPGTISVMARPWCDVYLGGRKLGRTPIVRVQLPSGRRTLRFLPLGKQPAQSRSVEVRPGQHTPMSVDLTDR